MTALPSLIILKAGVNGLDSSATATVEPLLLPASPVAPGGSGSATLLPQPLVPQLPVEPPLPDAPPPPELQPVPMLERRAVVDTPDRPVRQKTKKARKPAGPTAEPALPPAWSPPVNPAPSWLPTAPPKPPWLPPVSPEVPWPGQPTTPGAAAAPWPGRPTSAAGGAATSWLGQSTPSTPAPPLGQPTAPGAAAPPWLGQATSAGAGAPWREVPGAAPTAASWLPANASASWRTGADGLGIAGSVAAPWFAGADVVVPEVMPPVPPRVQRRNAGGNGVG